MSVYTDYRICFKRTIGITKKSRTIPAHTYKEAQKDKESECPHPTLRLVKNTRHGASADNGFHKTMN